jgi:hypothetical protein
MEMEHEREPEAGKREVRDHISCEKHAPHESEATYKSRCGRE